MKRVLILAAVMLFVGAGCRTGGPCVTMRDSVNCHVTVDGNTTDSQQGKTVETDAEATLDSVPGL